MCVSESILRRVFRQVETGRNDFTLVIITVDELRRREDLVTGSKNIATFDEMTRVMETC